MQKLVKKTYINPPLAVKVYITRPIINFKYEFGNNKGER